MARTAALILYRSELFRDVFSHLLARWKVSVRQYPLPEAPVPGELGAESTITLLLEARDDEEELGKLVCAHLLGNVGRKITVYVVDLAQDRIVEYRRREHSSIDVLQRTPPVNVSQE